MKQEITHKLFAFFLQKLGWKEVRSNQEGINIYLEPEQNNPFEIYLPIQKIKDYDRKIQDAISTLSIALEMPKQVVENKIRGLNNDLHNYRITENQNDGVQLSLMQTLLSVNRSLLLNASKYTRSLIYRDLTHKEKSSQKSPLEGSNDYLSQCKFLHTWQGSFGITIEAPLNLPSLGLFDDIPDTVERKTTKAIINGFKLINGAVENKSHDFIVDNISDPKEFLIFSSFPEILEIIKSRKIEYTVDTSPLIKIDASLKESSKSMLSEKTLMFVDRAIDQLKDPDTEKDITIVGFPETIKASKEDILSTGLFQGSRKVIVKGVSRDIDYAALTMNLSLEDYKKASKAQGEAKDVQVRCRVKKKNKGWEVLSVKSFQVI